MNKSINPLTIFCLVVAIAAAVYFTAIRPDAPVSASVTTSGHMPVVTFKQGAVGTQDHGTFHSDAVFPVMCFDPLLTSTVILDPSLCYVAPVVTGQDQDNHGHDIPVLVPDVPADNPVIVPDTGSDDNTPSDDNPTPDKDDDDKDHCNKGEGNGSEGCDPGNHPENGNNDEDNSNSGPDNNNGQNHPNNGGGNNQNHPDHPDHPNH